MQVYTEDFRYYAQGLKKNAGHYVKKSPLHFIIDGSEFIVHSDFIDDI